MGMSRETNPAKKEVSKDSGWSKFEITWFGKSTSYTNATGEW